MAANITVLFGADTKELDRAMGKVQGTTKKAGSVVAGAAKNMAKVLGPALLGRAVVGATKDFISFEDKVSGAASLLGTSMDKVKKQAKDLRFIDPQAAAEGQQQLAIVTQLLGQTGDEALATTGEMLKVAEAMSVVAGVDAARVVEGLSAAFRGEFDSIQRLIPSITAATVAQKALEMTGKSATSALTEQEKAQAVLAIVTAEGAKFQAKMGENTGTAAAKAREFKDKATELKLELGELGARIAGALLPVLTATLGVASKIPAEFIAMAGTAIGVTVAVGGLVRGLNVLRAHPIIGTLFAIGAALVFLEQKFNAVSAAVRRVGGALFRVSDTLNSIRRKAGFFGGLVDRIPGFQHGGIVTRPTLAMIGEAGPEAVVPLRGGRGGGIGSTVNVFVQGSVVSERDLVETVRRGLQSAGARGR